MKAEQFSDSLNQIQDKYIEEAASYGNSQAVPAFAYAPAPKNAPKPFRAMKIWRAVAIAACVLLAVGIGATAIGLSGSGGLSGAAAAKGGGYSEGAYNGYADSYDSGDFYSTEDAYDAEAPMLSDANGSMAAYEESEDAGGAETRSEGITSMVPQDANAKIIYTAFLDIDSTDFDASQDKIEAITKAHGGYFENLDQDSYSSFRNAYYKIRVPAEEFDAFLNEIRGSGTVTSVSQNAADVSNNYYDIESRLETAKTKLARLNELLSQAQNMSDIITIENEIADVQWEIDDLSGSLKNYDSQITYSTFTLNLHEVDKITDPDTPQGFGTRISNAFRNGLNSFAEGMKNVLLWLAASWLWILLVAIVAAVVIIILVKFTRKDRRTAANGKQSQK